MTCILAGVLAGGATHAVPSLQREPASRQRRQGLQVFPELKTRVNTHLGGKLLDDRVVHDGQIVRLWLLYPRAQTIETRDTRGHSTETPWAGGWVERQVSHGTAQ